jgi:hypothetical protein
VSITVKPIITDHDLSLIGDMCGDAGNKVEVVHLNLVGISLTIVVYDFALIKIEGEALEATSMGYATSPWPCYRHHNKNTGRFGGP